MFMNKIGIVVPSVVFGEFRQFYKIVSICYLEACGSGHVLTARLFKIGDLCGQINHSH